MTKEILIQYSDLGQEVKELQQDIQKLESELKRLDSEPESDCVKGSSDDFPYTCHSIVIKGINFTKKDKLYQALEKKKKMQEIKCDELLETFTMAEEFIETLKDSRMRRILRYKYVDKLTYIQMAHRIGGKATDESLRKEHDRFFEKK